MRLIIAEKPSVARDIARVLGATTKHEGFLEGRGLLVTWCIGHLAELEDPVHYDERWKAWSFETLPMLPESFDLRLRQGVKEHWAVLKRLMGDRQVEDLVNACDAGREGELIFRYVVQLANCRKPSLRLWTSSLTDEAIRDAWTRLAPSARFDALADAARSRSEADWLVGLNATRAMTCLARAGGGEQLLSVGRVQTPTLAMFVTRDRAIASFVPQDYWTVQARFLVAERGEATFAGSWFGADESPKPQGEREGDEPDEAPLSERLPREDLALAVVAAAQGQTGRIVTADRKRTSEKPPLLYDLTSLQRRANQRYGMAAAQTLEVAQALYERHKLLTYPRTDARYLTTDQVAGLPDIVRGLGALGPYAPFVPGILSKPVQPGKRVVNDAEVGDHHAIIPTGRTPEPERLSVDEKRIFDLVARRFLAVLMDDALFDVTQLIVAVDPGKPLPEGISAPLKFRSRGRICRHEGWRAADPPGRGGSTVELPPVEVGDAARTQDPKAVHGQTRPPRPHNDASILHAMETAGREIDDDELKRIMRNAGLGTPATRAAILQTLLDRGFIVREGRELRATERGMALIDAVPLEELKSAVLTGQWEARLAEMAEGRDAREGFMYAVRDHVRKMVEAIHRAPPPRAERTAQSTNAHLGSCPKCKQPVRETPRVYKCDAGPACGFVVYKTMAKREISARTVKQLLTDGKSAVLKGFKSREGKEFAAALKFADDFRVSFEFSNEPLPPKEPRAPRAEGGPEARPRAPKAPSSPRGGSGGAGGPGTAPAARPPSRAPARPQTATKPPPPPSEGQSCPECGQGRIIRGRMAFGCSRWREGCGWRGPF